jgi:N-acylneuraminate cytidylyltransferase
MTASVIAIIPARGGSVGVPRKNLQQVAGRTLVARAVHAARAAASIHAVVVSTDDEEIAVEARSAGAEVIARPTELATATASSESALLHALTAHAEPPVIVVFLQATSPFIDPADLDAAVARVAAGEADVVFAAVATPVFLWRPTGAGGWEGVNHDAALRPRRQDLPPQVAETGAFYVMRAEGFERARHRFFGRVEPQLTDERFAIDIDTPADLALATALGALAEPPPTHDPITAPGPSVGATAEEQHG